MRNVAGRISLAILTPVLALLTACSETGVSSPSAPADTATASPTSASTPSIGSPAPSSTAASTVTVTPVPSPVSQASPTSTRTAIPPLVHWTGPMDRIVYQATDGAIYTVKPDGTDRRTVSGVSGSQADATNVWPGWSPDSGTIVFSALSPVNGRSYEASLRRGSALGGSEPVILHVDGSTSNGINPGTPHYALWSPDG
jgi:hypothetical protein